MTCHTWTSLDEYYSKGQYLVDNNGHNLQSLFNWHLDEGPQLFLIFSDWFGGGGRDARHQDRYPRCWNAKSFCLRGLSSRQQRLSAYLQQPLLALKPAGHCCHLQVILLKRTDATTEESLEHSTESSEWAQNGTTCYLGRWGYWPSRNHVLVVFTQTQPHFKRVFR